MLCILLNPVLLEWFLSTHTWGLMSSRNWGTSVRIILLIVGLWNSDLFAFSISRHLTLPQMTGIWEYLFYLTFCISRHLSLPQMTGIWIYLFSVVSHLLYILNAWKIFAAPGKSISTLDLRILVYIFTIWYVFNLFAVISLNIFLTSFLFLYWRTGNYHLLCWWWMHR